MRRDTVGSYGVLFVDDEQKARKYFRLAYSNEFSVVTARSVAEALEILERLGRETGVLITDQRMPGQQGVDLLKRARERWPDIVRILTTAYSDLEDAIAAVNRGEILRYVTKPWDLEALRMELRHAMEFFLLHRERNLLVAEKFGVRNRMVHCDRLQGLLAIAAGLDRLRHASHAVAAWVRDGVHSRPVSQSKTPGAGTCGLAVDETLELMRVHHSLRELDDSVVPGYPDHVALADLLHGVGVPVLGQSPRIWARLGLLEPMMITLARLAGEPSSACLEETSAGCVRLSLSTKEHHTGSAPCGTDALAKASDTSLLLAYMVAWHHGGVLHSRDAETDSLFELTLPTEPMGVVLPEPDADWLAGQYAMLEDWG